LGGSYAQTFKQHALWGIFLPLYPGSLSSLTRDLAELLEVSLLFSSLFLLHRSKPFWGAILLTLAVLAKETALLVAVAAMLGYALGWRGGQQSRKQWYYFTLPIVIFLIWQTALRVNWGEFPILAGGGNLGVPFSGFISLLIDTSALQTPLQRRFFSQLVLLIVFTFVVIWRLRSTAAPLHEIFSWLLYLALALSLSRFVWVDDWAYLRALSEFSVLGIIIIIGANFRAKAIILGSFSTIWLYLSLRLLRHGG
jgi:hypothetical protein